MILLTGIFGVCNCVAIILPDYAVAIPAALASGWLCGLVVIVQASSSLRCGVQYACIKGLDQSKDQAGDWYLWTQVALQLGAILGSMGSSGGKRALMPVEQPLRPIIHPLDAMQNCGQRVCVDAVRGPV